MVVYKTSEALLKAAASLTAVLHDSILWENSLEGSRYRRLAENLYWQLEEQGTEQALDALEQLGNAYTSATQNHVLSLQQS